MRLGRGGSGADPNRNSYGSSSGLHHGLGLDSGHAAHSQLASGLQVDEETPGCPSPRGAYR
jgi:hypothetical protein